MTVGGLARSDSGNFSAEFADLLERLREAGGHDTTTSGGGPEAPRATGEAVSLGSGVRPTQRED